MLSAADLRTCEILGVERRKSPQESEASTGDGLCENFFLKLGYVHCPLYGYSLTA